jgi:hypothetical protein
LAFQTGEKLITFIVEFAKSQDSCFIPKQFLSISGPEISFPEAFFSYENFVHSSLDKGETLM